MFIFCSSFVLITDYSFINRKHPVYFEAEYRAVGEAEFWSKSVKDTHETYADGKARLFYFCKMGIIVPLNFVYKSFAPFFFCIWDVALFVTFKNKFL